MQCSFLPIVLRLEGAYEQIDKRIGDSRAEMDQRFQAVDKRFDAIDKRFDAIDRRFDTIDRRLGAMDVRINWLIGIIVSSTLAVIGVVVGFFEGIMGYLAAHLH